MVDTHRSIDWETSASADRVAAQLEILYWRELMWRKEHLLPAPEWQPGVCVAFAPGTGEPTRLCGQIEGVGAQAPVWFKSIYEGMLGPQAGLVRALTARQEADVCNSQPEPTEKPPMTAAGRSLATAL